MENVRKLIRQKENRKLEFKAILPKKENLIKTAISFSNSFGGSLIIGVDDKNKVVGIDENEIVKLEETISNTIYDNCIPNIMPNIYSARIDSKLLLVVEFYSSSAKPHYIKSLGKLKGTFVRVGSSNRLATMDILERLEREKRNISYDSIIDFGVVYEDGIFDVDIIEEKLNQKYGSVLEFGCANGNNLSLFYQFGWNVLGVDLSKDAIDNANNNFEKLKKEKNL